MGLLTGRSTTLLVSEEGKELSISLSLRISLTGANESVSCVNIDSRRGLGSMVGGCAMLGTGVIS
jgi:hypothetical protein